MKIGELARSAGTQAETIRYYEREGLLPPAPRTDANYRRYGAAHAERLAFIRACRALDMTLAEVRALLALKDNPGADCGAANALLDAHIGHVDQRIRSLEALQRELATLRARCAAPQDAAHCGILAGLQQGGPRSADAAVHVAGVHGAVAAAPGRRRR